MATGLVVIPMGCLQMREHWMASHMLSWVSQRESRGCLHSGPAPMEKLGLPVSGTAYGGCFEQKSGHDRCAGCTKLWSRPSVQTPFTQNGDFTQVWWAWFGNGRGCNMGEHSVPYSFLPSQWGCTSGGGCIISGLVRLCMFPPITQIFPTLARVCEEGLSIIPIASYWPLKCWLAEITQLLYWEPWPLPTSRDLLFQAHREILHPHPKRLALWAWPMGDSM